jgi:hypothetical protein
MTARYERVCRAVSLFLASLVGVVTVAVVVHAAQTITTPNAMTIPYSLAFSGRSAPIAIPVNRPVFVMGADTDFANNGNAGVGQATIIRNTSENAVKSVSFDYANDILVSEKASLGTTVVIFDLDVHDRVGVLTDGANLIVFNSDDSSSGAGIPVGHTGVITMIW